MLANLAHISERKLKILVIGRIKQRCLFVIILPVLKIKSARSVQYFNIMNTSFIICSVTYQVAFFDFGKLLCKVAAGYWKMLIMFWIEFKNYMFAFE